MSSIRYSLKCLLLIAFIIFLMCSLVSTEQEFTDYEDSEESEESEESEDSPESRYAEFEQAIWNFEKDCYDRAYQKIADSDRHDKIDQLKRLSDLYKNHVQNYPEQNRQAILDGQDPKPILRNADIAVRALCNQMLGFTS